MKTFIKLLLPFGTGSNPRPPKLETVAMTRQLFVEIKVDLPIANFGDFNGEEKQ
jgi:hypothetical protein